MTRAQIQALIDARGEITLPHGGHYLDGPLIMRAGTQLNLSGGALVNAYTAGAPLIVTPTDAQATQWGVRHGGLFGGAIELKPFTVAPNFFALEGLNITNAACAFDARTCNGAWMGRLANVHAHGCVDGFRQKDGTTMSFENCFANGCSGKAWDLDNVYDANLRSCAADNNSGQAVRFALCDGLSIASWYMEGNTVPSATFALIDGCHGDIAGMVSLGSALSAGSGAGAYLVQINGGRVTARGVLLGGSPKRNPDASSGPGLSQMLLLSGGAVVVLSGSEVYHADKAAGAGTAYSASSGFLDGGGNVIGAAA